MATPRASLQDRLAQLEASVPELRQQYGELDLVEAIASIGDDIAMDAGAHRDWVEDQVEQLLIRLGLIRPPQEQ